MKVYFCVKGRLGNAIFRYLASAILCIHYNFEYIINNAPTNSIELNELAFLNIISNLNNPKKISLNNSIHMIGYYQHDYVYRDHKKSIIEFINNNKEHYILTDGIKAGDGNYEKFFMKDILYTPIDFNKIYKIVLHVRLEDFVTHDLYLPVIRVTGLLNNMIKNNVLTKGSVALTKGSVALKSQEKICIVCNKIETKFENIYISTITHFLDENCIEYVIENNNVLTDYYIMKEAELLICSKSTLSWCAALLSDKIKQCYLPNYEITPNSTCKFPIENTILY